MTEDQRELIDRFNAVVAECGVFCFCTRNTELQNAACARLEDVRSLVDAAKAKAIENADESFANDLLGCSYLAVAMVAELEMWVLLKQENPDAAWNKLVSAQHNLANAMKASAGFSHLESRIERLDSIEKTVFPKQIFFSSGLVVKEEICSICNTEYEDCVHIKGRPCMGQLCVVRLIPLAVDHVAMVEQPASKYCRALTRRTDGVVRNIMTGLAEPSKDGPGDKSGEFTLHGIIASTSTFEDSTF
jgi:hypothetical protein